MPVSVVHLFEVIHIKHQQSKGSPELLEFLQRLFRLQFDIASIRKATERVNDFETPAGVN